MKGGIDIEWSTMCDNALEQAIKSLGELRLIKYHEVEHKIVAQVETLKKSVNCPTCGHPAKAKDRRNSIVQDLPVNDKQLVLMWRKRVWSCSNSQCPQNTWTETADFVSSRHSLTTRAKLDLVRQALINHVPVAQLAREWNVSWATARSSIEEAKHLSTSWSEPWSIF